MLNVTKYESVTKDPNQKQLNTPSAVSIQMTGSNGAHTPMVATNSGQAAQHRFPYNKDLPLSVNSVNVT